MRKKKVCEDPRGLELPKKGPEKWYEAREHDHDETLLGHGL